MSFQTLLMIMAIGILVIAWYANTSKRNVILCTFHRVNKTQIVKFVKMQSRYVVFDKQKYDILPSRISYRWYNVGFIHMLFPQTVATLTFSYASRWPLDTGKLEFTPESPEVRNALNKEEWVRSYYRGAVPQTNKTSSKLGGFSAYIPWIAIVLVVIVAVYFNSKMTGFGHTLDAVINTLNNMNK